MITVLWADFMKRKGEDVTISRGSMSKQITKSPGKRSSKWSSARKRRIDCKRPKGFSERAHCASKKRRGRKG